MGGCVPHELWDAEGREGVVLAAVISSYGPDRLCQVRKEHIYDGSIGRNATMQGNTILLLLPTDKVLYC